MERHHERIASYAWRRTGHRAETEDVVAETFARALEQLDQYRGDVPLHHWLLGIAARVVGRRTRRRTLEGDALAERHAQQQARRRAQQQARQRGDEGQRAVDAEDLLSRTRRAIDRLPEGQQAALTLHCFEGLEHARIAALLGVAVGTIKSRIHRAREALEIEVGE